MMIAMNALIFLMMIISTKSHIPVFISDPFSVTAVDGSTVEFTCTANDTEDIIYRVNSTSAELPDIKDKGFIQLYPEKLDSLLLRRNLSVTVSSAYSNTEIFCKAIGTGLERNENSDIAILTVQVLTPPTKPTRDNMVLIVATSISAEVFIMIVFIMITVLVLLWGYMKKRRTNSINTSTSGSTDIPEQISDDDEQGDDDTPKAPLLNGRAKDKKKSFVFSRIYPLPPFLSVIIRGQRRYSSEDEEENGLIRDDKDVEEHGPLECSSNESSDSHHSCVEESKT